MVDKAILEKYKLGAPPSEIHARHWANFLGLQTDTALFHSAGPLEGQFVSPIPDPDDGVYGGALEYSSLLTAIDHKADDRAVFTAVELGAGWGPWISAVGVVCNRLGYKAINLVGVEAEKAKFETMKAHLATNGLAADPVNSRLIRGAAWFEDTTLYFPKEMPTHDYGGAAATEKSDIDYRGQFYETEATPAFSLETICNGLPVIDYAHWDIQGAEWPIAAYERSFIDKHIRFLFIGTHSRRIEGNLLGLCHSMGWDVLEFHPCSFTYDRTKPSLEAMTRSDGGIFIRNPNCDGTAAS